MAKYSYKFKKKVVQAYLNGEGRKRGTPEQQARRALIADLHDRCDRGIQPSDQESNQSKISISDRGQSV